LLACLQRDFRWLRTAPAARPQDRLPWDRAGSCDIDTVGVSMLVVLIRLVLGLSTGALLGVIAGSRWAIRLPDSAVRMAPAAVLMGVGFGLV